MPHELERRYGLGHHHFITFSCHQRLPYFVEIETRRAFEHALEAARSKYGFAVDSYVVMPEHVHLLLSEPQDRTLSVALQSLKVSVTRKLKPRPFWLPRFYDFNVFSEKKWVEKRRYIHRNPFTRGLVNHPKEWVGSSYRHWAYGERGIVQVTSTWNCFDPPLQRE